MSRQGLMDDCGYHGFDECARYEECCDEAYERGRADALNEIIEHIKEQFPFWRTDLLADVIEKAEQLKEQQV